MSRNTVDVIVGGQFGSESKGRVTLDVVRRRLHEGQQVASYRVAGPNAGHVVIDPQGRRWAMRQLPVGFVESDVHLVIAAGSEVDARVLSDEIQAVEAAGYSVRNRLWIHPEATYLEPQYIEQEQTAGLAGRLGSTAKGIGAARSARIWRTARRVKDARAIFGPLGRIAAYADITTLRQTSVVIEGTQGYGLGLHAGHYPQCTSSNARATDFLGMAGVSPWSLDNIARDFTIWVVVRPYPIRVAGNSGELTGETTWEALGLPEERTTVTQKVRRVGEFDREIVVQAIEANGTNCTRLALAMADQVAPSLAGKNSPQALVDLPAIEAVALRRWIHELRPHIARIGQLGTGPNSSIWVNGLTVRDMLDERLVDGAL